MSCAFAQEEGHLRFLKYQSDYRVNPDATYTVVRRLSIKRSGSLRVCCGKVGRRTHRARFAGANHLSSQ